MRRNDKEIHNPAEIEAIIRRAKVCRLGLCDGIYPYVVPVCFGYEPGVLWIHSGPGGKKMELITANPEVSLEFDEVSGTVPAESPCAWGVRYESVIGRGFAEIVRDSGEKIHGLSCIMRQYSDKETFPFPDHALKGVCVIRIKILEMTGKRSPP
ncbi:MAG TPA: pyridoxamine 5'-phosphate oxidase family protein [Methanoregulaceae archaeon]|nr:pyridoxamine 5'-phosphate oxidase family protein [Methanoregulaceae archaeon]HPD75102.1 pyridoxamine 5'-phosphate oxidase family protein [Methanoregulaceae archaeon]HRY75464.1 pyridoxamine 5'-phosphate oxidase family protein [Methanoregulaceae archaeon]